MPHRYGRRQQSPDELARQIARRLSETSPPTPPRSSWRDSVLVGRLISGSVLAVATVAVVGAALVGVTRLMDGTEVVEPQVLSARVEAESTAAQGNDPESSGGDYFPVANFQSTTTTVFGLVTGTITDNTGTTAITFPPPTTTSSSPVDTASPDATIVTSTSAPGSTTAPPASTTSSAPQTTIPAGPSPTMPPPTVPTITTTIPQTTTTTPETTTTAESTTSTCANRGSGNGNC